MAIGNGSGESFLVCRYVVNVEGADDYVDASEHRSCIEALALARSWYGQHAEGRRAEVWCGVYNLFDSDRVVDFDACVKARCAPEAPGRYGYLWNEKGDDYSYVLIKAPPL